MRKRIKWLVVAGALAASAHAAGPGEFRLSPYLGLASTQVDGRHQQFGQSQDYDGWTAGISAGYRSSFGLLVEVGTSATGDVFVGWATGGELREAYASVGYEIEFAKDWRFTPKLGWTAWDLKAGEIEDLLDDRGERTKTLHGEDAFLELALARRFGEHIAIGLAVRAADVDFGSARSAAFTLTWAF